MKVRIRKLSSAVEIGKEILVRKSLGLRVEKLADILIHVGMRVPRSGYAGSEFRLRPE